MTLFVGFLESFGVLSIFDVGMARYLVVSEQFLHSQIPFSPKYIRECNALWGESERAIEFCCRLSSTVEDGALRFCEERGHSHTIRTQ